MPDAILKEDNARLLQETGDAILLELAATEAALTGVSATGQVGSVQAVGGDSGAGSSNQRLLLMGVG